MKSRCNEKCVLVLLAAAACLLTATVVAAERPAWSGLELRKAVFRGHNINYGNWANMSQEN